MIPFHEYIKIKDNICISYHGSSKEYLVLLDIIKPFMEKKLKGLKIFLNHQEDEFSKTSFIFKKEIKFDGHHHPIEQLINELEIKDFIINETVATTKAVVITKGNYPTKPLESHKINALKTRLKEFDVEIDTNINNAGIVAGVESAELFEAASKGIKTILVPTGIGTQLYKQLFPKGEVF